MNIIVYDNGFQPQFSLPNFNVSVGELAYSDNQIITIKLYVMTH